MHADAAAGGTSEGRQPTVDFHRAHVCHAYAGDRAPAQDRAISHANRAYEVFGRHNSRRSKVETTFHRYKAILGSAMRARGLASQRVEVRLGCKILNTMTALGIPDGEMIG